ncbi:DUF6519 domain-containing protein [Streptomyces sp. NPDC057474]|uniref:DUF6519 domain-containing protein n=1 Tax=Streptomyces sp. NPDC057474 TaxID=3346144 RepID=UPI00369C7635
MGADLSRVRFDALRDHSGVVMQQGRLLLDSDWNEFVSIVDRRLRAAAADLGTPGVVEGFSGVAVVPRTTPDAFKITAPVEADGLNIGRGRMYVDGLLAENHGTGDGTVLDPLLAGPVRPQDTPYDRQPYLPTQRQLPSDGTHLVYLDVWQREVTPLQAPDLIEEAVGVDTTARTQTVWQVRVHEPDTPGISCATRDEDIPGWSQVIAPSTGRLTTGTVTVAAADNPCELPPSGDYRGLENQTYRVEIHGEGSSGTATFKWSRDNGSVAMRVVEIVAPDRLRPEHLGRDTVLGLRENDWVEILDDHLELDGLPGEMRRIDTVHGDGTVSFSPALPPGLPTTTEEAVRRNLRIRRWDQASRIKNAAGTELQNLDDANSPGVITVPPGKVAVVLEHGVTVTLDAPDGEFRTGDHWIFTARTGSATVERLVDAPPLGIHHHYARLAVVDFPSDVRYDCRELWPSCDGDCGDCTICVTPESHANGAMTIQAAVDTVSSSGGTVCLAAGVYHLGQEDVVRVDGARSVRVRGQGPGTVVIGANGGFDVRRSAFLTLEDFALVSAGSRPGIRLRTTAEVTARRLTVLMAGGGHHNGSGNPYPAFELSGVSLRTRVQDCDVVGNLGVSSAHEDDDRDRDGDGVRLLTADLEISGNLLVCRRAGVRFGDGTAHLLGNTVRDNTVLRGRQIGLGLLGAVAKGASVDLTGNHLRIDGDGIVVAPGGYTVRDNTVTGTMLSMDRGSGGIVVRAAESGVLRGPTRVTGNQVRGVGGAGIAVRAPVGDLDVSHNVVDRAADGIVVTGRGRAAGAVVVGNTVRGLATEEFHSDPTYMDGIRVVGAAHALVGSNTVVGVGTVDLSPDDDGDGNGDVDGYKTGVAVLACRESRVLGNTVEQVGLADLTGSERCVGVHVSVFARTTVEGSFCRRDAADLDDGSFSRWTGLLVGDDPELPRDGDDRQFRAAHIGRYVAVDGQGVSYLIGPGTAFVNAATDVSAIVSTNTVTGGSWEPAARITVAGDVVLSANQCRQHTESHGPAVSVTASSATVNANRVRGGRLSMTLDVDPARLAVLGNVTSGVIDAPGGLDPKWVPLNVTNVP